MTMLRSFILSVLLLVASMVNLSAGALCECEGTRIVDIQNGIPDCTDSTLFQGCIGEGGQNLFDEVCCVQAIICECEPNDIINPDLGYCLFYGGKPECKANDGFKVNCCIPAPTRAPKGAMMMMMKKRAP